MFVKENPYRKKKKKIKGIGYYICEIGYHGFPKEVGSLLSLKFTYFKTGGTFFPEFQYHVYIPRQSCHTLSNRIE